MTRSTKEHTMTTSRAAGIPGSAATRDSRAENTIRGSFRQRLGGSRLARSVTASFAVGAVAVAMLAGAAPAYASDLNPDHDCFSVDDDGISTVAANPAGPGYWNLEEAAHPGGGTLWSVDGAPIFRGGGSGGILRATPDGKGLYLVDVDGSIKSYGDAVQFGSVDANSKYSYDECGDVDDNRIAGIALTPSGKGMVALDEEGHVWAIGDAKSYGEEVLSGVDQYSAISMTPDGKGYTLLAKNGSVYTFGDAGFYGHTGVTGDATALVTTADGKGYWIMNSSRSDVGLRRCSRRRRSAGDIRCGQPLRRRRPSRRRHRHHRDHRGRRRRAGGLDPDGDRRGGDRSLRNAEDVQAGRPFSRRIPDRELRHRRRAAARLAQRARSGRKRDLHAQRDTDRRDGLVHLRGAGRRRRVEARDGHDHGPAEHRSVHLRQLPLALNHATRGAAEPKPEPPPRQREFVRLAWRMLEAND